MQKLTPRLALLLEFCLPHRPVWDLFCDHGYLGEGAIALEIFSEVHFNDQVPEIVNALKLRLADDGYDLASVQFHACDASALDWSLVNGNIVLAGVGGDLMMQILERALAVTMDAPRRFILCPQSRSGNVREFLSSYSLEETSIEERGRLREIFILDLSN